jgi:hypothetical protein
MEPIVKKKVKLEENKFEDHIEQRIKSDPTHLI